MGVTITADNAYWTWDDSPTAWQDATETWEESRRTHFAADISEGVTCVEGTAVSFSKAVAENCTMRDAIENAANTYRVFAENLDVSVYEPIGPSHVNQESVLVKEMFNKKVEYLLPITETVNIDEQADRTVVFAERKLKEAIHINDVVKKEIVLNKKEGAISLSEKWIENANAVIEMISFFMGSMDEISFAERANTVNGYSAFQKFLVGDYEYQKALVRISVKSTQLDSGINLFNVVHNVDIPDTDDRGTVTVTDTTQATKVYFNKFYYTAPRVAVTLIGGTTADGFMIPVVVNENGNDEDGRYFEFELKNSNGQRTTGTVVWVAKGY